MPGFNAIGEAAIGDIYEPNQYEWTLLSFGYSIPVHTPELISFSYSIPVVDYNFTLISFRYSIPVIGNESVVVDVENPESPVYGNY